MSELLGRLTYEGVVSGKIRYFDDRIGQTDLLADIRKKTTGRLEKEWMEDTEQRAEDIQTAHCIPKWRRIVHVAVDAVKVRHLSVISTA